jgi:hypothetical protein
MSVPGRSQALMPVRFRREGKSLSATQGAPR